MYMHASHLKEIKKFEVPLRCQPDGTIGVPLIPLQKKRPPQPASRKENIEQQRRGFGTIVFAEMEALQGNIVRHCHHRSPSGELKLPLLAYPPRYILYK